MHDGFGDALVLVTHSMVCQLVVSPSYERRVESPRMDLIRVG
jgi:hypothetical protein